ncbi:hypothetical protein PsYK624_161050 [Phanerochaete sordida]|uniref:Uncharacterized protein n=1 Tax=Phanerochaete sordida TaxID=48140 RepID=A0A9P3GQV1_9APHY|nr:hypothetical protein PsYK624_161050 [Phanerochaete sordida]
MEHPRILVTARDIELRMIRMTINTLSQHSRLSNPSITARGPLSTADESGGIGMPPTPCTAFPRFRSRRPKGIVVVAMGNAQAGPRIFPAVPGPESEAQMFAPAGPSERPVTRSSCCSATTG